MGHLFLEKSNKDITFLLQKLDKVFFFFYFWWSMFYMLFSLSILHHHAWLLHPLFCWNNLYCLRSKLHYFTLLNYYLTGVCLLFCISQNAYPFPYIHAMHQIPDFSHFDSFGQNVTSAGIHFSVCFECFHK